MPDALHIALATCRELPDWECDDEPLHAALASRGVSVSHAIWNDPSVDWATYDAVLIRTTWDYADQRDAFVAWAERTSGVTRLFNPADVVEWNTDKSYLLELGDAGIPIAPTRLLRCGSAVDVSAVMRDADWSRGFLKPRIGATSRETLRFTADPAGLAEAQAHLDRTVAEEDMLLQPYLRSVETRGEVSVIVIDGAIAHAVRKTPVPGDYRTQDDFGATDEPHQPTQLERDLTLRTAARVPGLLYARVDFLELDDGSPVVNELEVVEPSLFFRHGPDTAHRLADALLTRARG